MLNKKMTRLSRALIIASVILAAGLLPNAAAPAKPNVVLIMADDMGYSDIGSFGSEIPTPNLDALAAGGLRFSQFYNTARCSPTRAALLTGLHPHQAGMGTLAEDPGKQAKPEAAPGYQEYLNDRGVTLAEALRPAGYRTLMSGKWHLGYHGEHKWPLARGFDRFYGIISGASSYFTPTDPRGLTLDNTPLPAPTHSAYYTTDAFTDYALQFLREAPAKQPLFLYLAYTAPHWPLHARQADIEQFKGKYRAGWDNLRAARYERQKQLGILSADTALSPRDDGARAWDDLTDEQQAQLDYRMAVYAAQVHRMDWNIGRVVAQLRDSGRLDNTVILFLSDNGGCAEPYTDLGGGAITAINKPSAGGPGNKGAKGEGGSSYGTGWANASNTPFRRYKSRLHEGGIATPLIVHWPAGMKAKPGSINSTPGYLTDVMPTVLELTGTTYPAKTRSGDAPFPLLGRSLSPAIAGQPLPEKTRWFFWEQYNNKAVRHGDWKAVQPAEPGSPWELYNLSDDRTELHNLAAAEPARLNTLTNAWQEWAQTHQVLPKSAVDAATPRQPNIIVFLSDDHGQLDSTPYGATDVRTPHMQRLADAGLVFDRAFVASPACAPSRTAMLTGLMPARNGAEANHTYKRDDVRSLPEVLRELGYETAAFGKVSHGPTDAARHGFDVTNPQYDPATVEAFLKARDPKRPLCLFVGTHSPHVPWPANDGYAPDAITLPPYFVDTPDTRAFRCRYYTDVTKADTGLGAMFELARQYVGDTNTLFLYTSDHGAQWPFGKWNLYDAGMATPMIAAWPGVITPGTRTAAMVQWIDLLPTFIAAAGGRVPDDIDGRSFLPVLQGKATTHRDVIFTTHSGDGRMNVYPIRAIRTGDWKLILNLHPEFAHTTHIDKALAKDGGAYWVSWFDAARTNAAAAAIVKRYHERPAVELYNLRADPFETNNLANVPAQANRVKDLRAQLEAWMKAQGDQQTVFKEPRLLSDPASIQPGKNSATDNRASDAK